MVRCCIGVPHAKFGIQGVHVPDDEDRVDCGFEDVRGDWGEEIFKEVFAGLSAVPWGAETESEAFLVWCEPMNEQRGERTMETNRSP